MKILNNVIRFQNVNIADVKSAGKVYLNQTLFTIIEFATTTAERGARDQIY